MSMEYNEHTKRSSEQQNAEFSLNFKGFWKSFKRYWLVSLICCIVFAIASFAYFKTTFVPKYRSVVRFTITPLIESNADSGASVYSFNYNATLATQMASTFPHIINSSIMADIIANDLQRNINSTVAASAVTDTNIFEVTVTSNSAQDAYDTINSIIENYPKIAEYVVGDTRMDVIEGSEPYLATKPYNEGEDNIKIALFAVIGFLVGVAVAFIDMYTRKTVVNKNDIEVYFNGKCICEVPVVKKKRTSKSSPMLKVGSSASGFSESIRVLKQRTRTILKNNGTKVVGVTSAINGEGKTTVAYNLANSLSGLESRVLLIDMDLHKRGIQNSINRKQEVPDIGITDVAAGKATMNDIINSISDTFDVIFAGTENIKFKKERFSMVFEYARQHYDYIVVDMPTCSIVSETVQIADLCDEMLFVVKSEAISPDKVYGALKDMAFSDVRIMGFVVNQVEQNSNIGGYKYVGRYGKRRYGYGYGYGYSNYGYGYGHGYGYGREKERASGQTTNKE